MLNLKILDDLIKSPRKKKEINSKVNLLFLNTAGYL